MNLKTLVYIIVGLVVFLGIWLFSMLGGLALMIGFGFGVLLHNYIDNTLKKYQKNIYLSQKANMEQRERELEAELKKIKKDVA
jgi:uncharacterized membrane protein YhiD involved in acid resistance